jgi:hypothetical protein
MTFANLAENDPPQVLALVSIEATQHRPIAMPVKQTWKFDKLSRKVRHAGNVATDVSLGSLCFSL